MTRLPGPSAGPDRSRQCGFTLVEAMVALLVLSIGLLGIAALYVETLRSGRTALYRTSAVNFAADIADRMRANRNPTNAYACGNPCVPANGGNAVADADLATWMADIAATLPGGSAGITFTAGTATTPPVYLIQVSWSEVGQATAAAYQLRVEI